MKDDPPKKPMNDDAPKKPKIVKPKTVVAADDDQALLRLSMQKAKEMKSRQADEEERQRRLADDARRRGEDDARARRDDDARRKLDEERRKLDDERRRLEQDEGRKLDEERRKLDEERRKIREEKERMERDRALETERRQLEDERRQLEEERRRLQAEPDRRKLTSKGKRRTRDEDSGDDFPEIDPAEMDEILSLSRDTEKKGVSGKSKAAGLKAAPTPTGKPAAPDFGAKAKRATPIPDSKAKRATPMPAPKRGATKSFQAPADVPVAERADEGEGEGDEAQLLVTRPESAKDWIEEIKTGIDWRKYGLTYGAPGLLAFVLLVYFSSAFQYGCFYLPNKRAIQPLAVVAKLDPNVPPPAPPPEQGLVWLPVGPIRLYVPADGPLYIDWERPADPRRPAGTERIVLVFPGSRIEMRRHPRDAIINWLKDQVSNTLLEQYVQKGDQGLVDEAMATTPDDFEWFSGPGWVDRFKGMLTIKEQLFPEIRRGLLKVTYGNQNGYFFGEPGRDDQRIELFDGAGRRSSYSFHPGGVMSAPSRLRTAQPSAPNYILPAKQAYQHHLAEYEAQKVTGNPDGKGNPEPYREHLRAAMYAAALAMSDDLESARVDDLRTTIRMSPFSKLFQDDEKEARAAFDGLRGATTRHLPELRRVLLGLYTHPGISIQDPIDDAKLVNDDRFRERAKKLFEVLMNSILAPGDAGYRFGLNWVENEEAREKAK